MIGEHSWITFLCCQCRCQIFKGERYFRTVFYYNFQTVLVAIVYLKAETSHYGAARGFYRPSLLTPPFDPTPLPPRGEGGGKIFF